MAQSRRCRLEARWPWGADRAGMRADGSRSPWRRHEVVLTGVGPDLGICRCVEAEVDHVGAVRERRLELAAERRDRF